MKKKLKKAFSIPGEELPGSLTADVLYIAIDLVNLSIPGSAFQLSLNSHSKRLERQLSKSYIMAGARRTEFFKKRENSQTETGILGFIQEACNTNKWYYQPRH